MDMPGMSSPDPTTAAGMDGMDNMNGTDMNGMNGSMGGMDMGGMSMAMYFNFMMPFTTVFKGWEIADQGTLIGSCFGVVGLAILYEIMKTCRLVYERKVLDHLKKLNEMDAEDSAQSKTSFKPRKIPQFWFHHSFQSILQMVQVFLAYFLMLIIMTYNVWLVLSACVGAGVGYFLAGGMLVAPIATSTLNKDSKGKRDSGSCGETSFSVDSDYIRNQTYYDNKTMQTKE